MDGFKLDTSGSVAGPGWLYTWETLPNDFTRSYIEAGKRAFPILERGQNSPHAADWLRLDWRFSDLAAVTVQQMIADCERYLSYTPLSRGLYERSARSGANFWSRRQAGEIEAFPPLRLALSEDGKIIQQTGGE